MSGRTALLMGLSAEDHAMLWCPMICFAIFAKVCASVFTKGSAASHALVRFSSCHNLILATFSLVTTVLGVQQLAERPRSIHGALCAAPPPAPRLVAWWYYSKFYEWVDTALLLARGKTLSSLHYNHHMTAATVVASHIVGRAQREPPHRPSRPSIFGACRCPRPMP